jgi:transposase-like protein
VLVRSSRAGRARTRGSARASSRARPRCPSPPASRSRSQTQTLSSWLSPWSSPYVLQRSKRGGGARVSRKVLRISTIGSLFVLRRAQGRHGGTAM